MLGNEGLCLKAASSFAPVAGNHQHGYPGGHFAEENNVSRHDSGKGRELSHTFGYQKFLFAAAFGDQGVKPSGRMASTRPNLPIWPPELRRK